MPEYTIRNFEERGFTVGIGGYVAVVETFQFHPFKRALETCRLRKDSTNSSSLSTPSDSVQHWCGLTAFWLASSMT